jgi:hypothetical protein
MVPGSPVHPPSVLIRSHMESYSFFDYPLTAAMLSSAVSVTTTPQHPDATSRSARICTAGSTRGQRPSAVAVRVTTGRPRKAADVRHTKWISPTMPVRKQVWGMGLVPELICDAGPTMIVTTHIPGVSLPAARGVDGDGPGARPAENGHDLPSCAVETSGLLGSERSPGRCPRPVEAPILRGQCAATGTLPGDGVMQYPWKAALTTGGPN